MNKQYFFNKIKDVTIQDFAALFPMIIGFLLSPLYKQRYSKTWLIGETGKEARDNGYFFYKYMRTKHPDQDCLYFIKPHAPDAKKVVKLGPSVKQGSIKHWICYFTCEWIISSQKGGKPNASLCAYFELNGLFKPHFVFLQHGVTKDKNSWLMADKCVFDYVITATRSEYEFMKKAFGYKKNTVQFTGFPRYDNLHQKLTLPNRIIVMPTWRTWLTNNSSKGSTSDSDFENSHFLTSWLELLNSQKLETIAREFNLEILFYPHRNYKNKIGCFQITNPYIKIADSADLDIQFAMLSSSLMITDYSSVYFDMFYMKKPVIFYQFDEDEFRKHHYEKGWFDYHKNPFSISCSRSEDVLEMLVGYIKNGFNVSKEFLDAHAKEFEYYDTNNSERIYQLLSKTTNKTVCINRKQR